MSDEIRQKYPPKLSGKFTGKNTFVGRRLKWSPACCLRAWSKAFVNFICNQILLHCYCSAVLIASDCETF